MLKEEKNFCKKYKNPKREIVEDEEQRREVNLIKRALLLLKEEDNPKEKLFSICLSEPKEKLCKKDYLTFG